MQYLFGALRAAVVLLAVFLPPMHLLAQEPAPITACPTPAHATGPCACNSLHAGEFSDDPAGLPAFERLSGQLALTDTQKQELATLIEMYRPRIQELARRTRTSSLALTEVAPDDPAYNSRAIELSERAGAAASEVVTLLAELQASAYALLTSEQQAKFMQLRAEQRARFEQMRERMQERRERDDWQPGMHSHHGKYRHHCMPEPAADPGAPAADSN